MPAGTTDLLCGNDAYSYYHIVARHYGEWAQKSVLTNENWREIADYAIAEALRNPTSISYRADANTFCYSRECGYRLQLVYLDESLNGMKRPTRRVYVADGQVWAE